MDLNAGIRFNRHSRMQMRTLKVYVEDGSHPSLVKTVVWSDD
jgi:hypothetical protein